MRIAFLKGIILSYALAGEVSSMKHGLEERVPVPRDLSFPESVPIPRKSTVSVSINQRKFSYPENWVKEFHSHQHFHFGKVNNEGWDMGGCPFTPEENKRRAVKLYHSARDDQSYEFFAQHYWPNFIQHDPNLPDGIRGLLHLWTDGELAGHRGQSARMNILRASADDDLVWLHTRWDVQGTVHARVDIYRFECGKIAEHFEVAQDTKLVRPPANGQPHF